MTAQMVTLRELPMAIPVPIPLSIDSGWDPAQDRDHTIEIGDPPGAPGREPPRPWWRLW